MFAMLYSSNLERMLEFYRDGLGIKSAAEGPFFVEFQTGMTSLALLAIHPQQTAEFELCFAVDDVDSAVEKLAARGMQFIDDVRQQPFGKLIHMRDPEGLVVTLLEPVRPSATRGTPQLASILVNSWDFGSTVRFYRDRLGLHVLSENPHAIEFGTGGARIEVHARVERPDTPAHARQKVACAFEVDDVDAFTQALRGRGTTIATDPTEELSGTYAEVIDPEGNLVVFREPAGVVAAVAAAVEVFEDDDVPQRTAIRKPLKKGSKAVSRLVLKPDYKQKPTKSAARPKKAAATNGNGASNGKPTKEPRVKSVRGAGPNRTRLAPKKKRDARAKSKPAIGRLRKAEARSVSRKKQAVATASRSRPVKRAAAKASRARRPGRSTVRGRR